MQAVLKDLDTRMNTALEALAREFATVRTGRASTALLDSVRVDYYGTPTPISQMASLSTPDARTLVIQPWEVAQLKEIEKAITKADLGVTPANDGKLIRLTMPTPTEERRKQLVKTLAKDKKVSEDEERRGHDQIQKTTDRFIAKVDETLKKKEQEILSF
jgi:ribosome recycling factor